MIKNESPSPSLNLSHAFLPSVQAHFLGDSLYAQAQQNEVLAF